MLSVKLVPFKLFKGMSIILLPIGLALLAYTLYYISGMMLSYRLWLWNDELLNIDPKNRPAHMITLQKTIINTVVDLLNSLVEANIEANKNFFYEIINTRLNVKITRV